MLSPTVDRKSARTKPDLPPQTLLKVCTLSSNGEDFCRAIALDAQIVLYPKSFYLTAAELAWLQERELG